MADEHYLIYADLRACGWSVDNAWNVAFNGVGASWSNAMLEREKKRLESLESVQKRIEDVKGERTREKEDLTQEELAKETSKEKILKDLVLAQRKAKYGSPEWLKIVAAIADYNKIKQDEIDTDNNTVMYYLPVSYPTRCSDCLLNKNGIKDIKNKKGNK